MIKIIVLFCFFQCSQAFAFGKSLHIAVVNSRPPYIFEETQSGIEIEIIKAIVKKMDRDLKLIFLSPSSLFASLSNDDIEGVSGVYDVKSIPLFFSQANISYHNEVIFIKNSKVEIKKLEDLAKYSVSSFTNAKFIFGDNFKRIVEKNKFYIEHKDQSIQPRLLFSGRVDTVISDINIFNHYKKSLPEGLQKPVRYAQLFEKKYFNVAFKSSKIRDDFDAAFTSIKNDGTYQKILDSHPEIELKD